MIACVVKNLLLIAVLGLQQAAFGIAAPTGLLIYTLTSMGYVIDVYRGDEPFEKNWFRFALFCTFFGKIICGPIVQYGDMRQQLVERKPSLSAISNGLILFVSGLAKQVILAGNAQEMYQKLMTIPQESLSIVSVWLIVLSFTFSLYFTLSGYCDMARGLAQIYSMRLPENFHYPFQSRTVSDFFNRFNITVTQFFNRYVYVMLGGDSNGTLSTAVNISLTAMLLGLWFGFRVNYLLWGCWFALLILLERWFFMKVLVHIPVFFSRVYTFILVLLSFTIFASDSLQQTWFYMKTMFGFGAEQISNGYSNYILSCNWPLVLLCFFFMTSVGNLLSRGIKKRYPLLHAVGSGSFYVGLLAVSVSLLL